MTEQGTRTVKQLSESAEGALGNDAFRAKLTPVLPAAWPSAKGRVLFYVYRSESLPTGRVKFRVTGPTHKVEFVSLAADPVVTSFPGPAVLGEEERQPAGEHEAENLERAEQTLLDIVAGNRAPENAREQLRPYGGWLDRNPIIARDLETRTHEFISWLRGGDIETGAAK